MWERQIIFNSHSSVWVDTAAKGQMKEFDINIIMVEL